jgi:hypothetical protein
VSGSWTIEWAPPSKYGFFRLAGISALADDDVWAVGDASGPGMIAHRDATSWNYISFPYNLLNIELSGVAALSARDVWAVGYESPFFNDRTYAAHWDGVDWMHVPTPLLHDYSSEKLFAVAGSSSADVWAVGAVAVIAVSAGLYGPITYRRPYQPLILHWDGSRWAPERTPALNFEGALLGAAVVDADNAWAVGYFVGGPPPTTEALLASWRGGAWKPHRSPTFGLKPAVLWSVATMAPDDAWAVGEEGYPNGQALALHWNGRDWLRITTPQTPERSLLRGVSCVSPNDAWAVGTEFVQGAQHTRVLHWDGSSWTRELSPDPFPAQLLTGVSALPNGRAWAAGFYLDGAGWTMPLVLSKG